MKLDIKYKLAIYFCLAFSLFGWAFSAQTVCSVVGRKTTRQFGLLLLSLFLFFGLATASSAQAADYYAEGTMRSENLLSGAEVTDITGFDVTATVPTNTAVSISFSQDRVNFYSSDGTAFGWDSCSDGSTSIDISGLSWSGGVLFYKLKLETTDVNATPVVSEVTLTYAGEIVPTPGNAHYAEGTIVSTDLLDGTGNVLIKKNLFGYNIESLPTGTNVYAQFSVDGINFYSSSGTQWDWDTLEEGDYTTTETALSLATLDWKGEESFYYKLKFTSAIDNKTTPVVKQIGLLEFTNTSIGEENDAWMSDGLVGYWKMDESSWDGTSGEVIDASGNGNDGTRTGDATTAGGKYGNGGTFDGTGDYVSTSLTSETYFKDTTFTITFWAKGDYAIAIGKKGYDGGFFIKNGGSGSIQIKPVSGSPGNRDDDGIINTDDGNWHFFAAVITTNSTSASGNEAHIYEDGELHDGAYTQMLEPYSSDFSYPFSIGARTEIGHLSYFNGDIDEVRIYNRALNPDEVNDLYEYAPGPVLHLKMDEKSGTTAYDTSGNGNDGTLTNGPSWTRGKYGSALSFDGSDDYVDLSSELSSFSSLDNTTISMWIKPNSEHYAHLLAMTDKSTTSNMIGFGLRSEGNLFIQIKYDGNQTVWFPTTETYPIDEWAHIVVKLGSEGNFIYLNGVKMSGVYSNGSASVTDSFSDINSANTVRIGSRMLAEGYDNYFDGLIDDVKIYNYARTQKQILEDMNAGNPANKSPVLHLSFDEGYGDTAHDKSSFGNDGAVTPGSSGDNTTVSSMWDKNGKVGGAMEFDGIDDYVSCGSDSDFDITSELSISAWYKSSGLVGNHGGIVSKSDDLTKYFSSSLNKVYELGVYSNVLYFQISNGSSTEDVHVSGSAWSEDGNWHHLLANWDGTTNDDALKIYVDGELVASDSSVNVSSIQTKASDLDIGGYNYTYPFSGFLDEVKIWNYALTEDEIKQEYNSGSAIVMGGGNATADNDGVTVTGASTKYCVPGDTAQCDAPVLELSMDEKTGTTAYDTSGNGNDGTLTGGPSWTRGKYGSALEFDGVDDYVTMGDVNLVEGLSEITISAWVNFKEDTGSRIIDKYGVFDFSYDSGNNRFQCILETFSNGDSIYGEYFTPEINKWYYLTVVWDGVDGNFYLDGLDQTNDSYPISLSGPLDKNSYDVSIGAQSVHHNANFSGQIDDVKIYDYARTPAQIAWDYNKGGPIAEWRFDEGEGTTVHDESGNGNDGTMNNMDSSTDWVDGHAGKALDFDGVDDYVDVPDNALIGGNITDEFSVSIWINSNVDLTTNGNKYRVLEKGDCYFFLQGSNGTGSGGMNFFVKRNGVGYVAEIGQSLSANSWYHLVGTFDGNDIRVYLNGVYKDITNVDGDIDDDGLPLRLGSDDFNSYFNGKIDEVKIYNYALTEEQIKNVYNGGAMKFE